MLESVNAVSEGPGGTEESDRIDALLSSALADQARERRMLVETVFGAKTALVKAEEELAGIRELINKRDESLLESVAKQLEAVAKNNEPLLETLTASIAKNNEALVETITARVQEAIAAQPKPRIQPARDVGLTLRIEAIEEAIIQLAQRIADLSELPAQLRRDLEVSAGAIGDRIGEESASLLADLREDQVEVVQTLAAMSQAEVSELKGAIDSTRQEINSTKRELLERVSMAGRDTIEAGRSTVEQMVEHLTGYLQERDEQLYRARDQRLIDLFQQLSDTIGRATKRKLGKVMEDSGPPKPLQAPLPPVKAPPPLSIPRTFRQPPRDETESTRTPFSADPGDPGSLQDLEPPPPVSPDPAFAFGEPDRAPFDLNEPASSSQPPPPLGQPQPQFRRPESPFGEKREPSPTHSLANPLTRAELVRDYLIESPSEMFLEEPPVAPAPKMRRKPQPKREGESPVKPRSGPAASRPPKPPAGPRTRRKA